MRHSSRKYYLCEQENSLETMQRIIDLSVLRRRVYLLVVAMFGLTACMTYTTPGGGVSLANISNYDIEKAFEREPAATFPANMAMVRVQATGYASMSTRGYGYGNFTVVTTRDFETEADFETLASVEGIANIAPLTRILIPENLVDTESLRISAAQLKADLLLLYTIDTAFRTDKGQVGPLQTLSLGFLPNRKSHVDATTSAMVLDVRTGFVYGTAEFSATESQRSDFWGTEAAIETARFAAEKASFRGAVEEMQTLLKRIVEEQTPSS